MPIKRYISLAIGILIILVALYFVGIDKFITQISNANIYMIALGTFVFLFTFPLRALVVKKTLVSYKNLASFIDCQKCVFLGQFTNMILPSRLGDIARGIYLNKKSNIPLRIGITNVIINRLWDLIGIISVAIFALIVNPMLFNEMGAMEIVIIAIAITVILALGIKNMHNILKLIKPLISKLLKRFKIKKEMKNLEEDVMDYIQEIWSNKPLTIELFIISFVLWSVECLVTYIMFLALGFEIEITIVLAVITLANLTKIIPTTPQGIGTFEASAVLLFSYFGIPPEISLTVVIIDHLIKNIITIAMGFFIIEDVRALKKGF